MTALTALPARFDRSTAEASWISAGISAESHEVLWETFDAAGLFTGPADDPESWWAKFGWGEARVYHGATRDYPFLQMDQRDAFTADAERMRSYADEGSPPAVYQRCGDGPQIDLPRAPGSYALEPGAELNPVQIGGDLDRVGALLDICFGERGRIAIADGSTCLLKNIPSGGARHPTEAFLAVFSVPGIPAGIYHYDVEHHRLTTVRSGQHDHAFADATLDLFVKFDTPPAAALVFTSLVERAMWRYRDPRSFRAVLVDVGHAVSAYRRAAGLLGYRTYAYQKMHDEQVANLLGIDRFAQPPLYVGTLVP